MTWEQWDAQHQRDMDNGVPGAKALSVLVVVTVIIIVLGAVGGMFWLAYVMIAAFKWAVLWYLGGGILTIWIGFALMYVFSSITRLKEAK